MVAPAVSPALGQLRRIFAEHRNGIGLLTRNPAARLPIPGGAYKKRPDGATWRSGYATVCKTVYTSSILVVASIHIINDLA